MIVKAQNKFQVFNDLDGNPLNNGYVYMGTAGSNPETNPITVYSDSALTIPVAQPLRTIGGHIVVNGSRINVYTDGDYSITSRESDGSLIYSSLSGNIDAVQESAISALSDVTTASTTGVAAVESAETTALGSIDTAVAAIEAEVTKLNSITSGTYTPSLTGTTNVSSLTTTDLRYKVIGGQVTIEGIFKVTPTATGAVQVVVNTFPTTIPSFTTDGSFSCHGATGSDLGTKTHLYGFPFSSTAIAIRFTADNTNFTRAHFTISYTLV